MNKKLLVFIVLILTAWLVFLTYELSSKPELETTNTEINEYTVKGISTDLSEVVKNNKTSIVSIEQGSLVSTGFIYEKKDNMLYVATTLHGVLGQEEINVYLHNGSKLVGNIKDKDIYLDLALLECECPYEVKPISFTDNKLIKDGEFVIAIGTCGSLEYDFSSQFGMISSKYREVDCDVVFEKNNYSYYLGMIQLSGEFKEGYSGAPVFNMFGQVVGMINSKDNGVVLADMANELKLVLNKMLNSEEYRRINLGISGRFINELENYEKTGLNIRLDEIKGYFVENVKLASLASNIGIYKGDIILDINSNEINDIDSFLAAIYSDSSTYNFTIIRNGEEINITGNFDD